MIKYFGDDYEIVEDVRDGYVELDVNNLFTDYFIPYDYIFGDWSYGKLRLKGFCNKRNRRYKKNNDIDNLKSYITNNCSFGCRYFLLKKVVIK